MVWFPCFWDWNAFGDFPPIGLDGVSQQGCGHILEEWNVVFEGSLYAGIGEIVWSSCQVGWEGLYCRLDFFFCNLLECVTKVKEGGSYLESRVVGGCPICWEELGFESLSFSRKHFFTLYCRDSSVFSFPCIHYFPYSAFFDFAEFFLSLFRFCFLDCRCTVSTGFPVGFSV